MTSIPSNRRLRRVSLLLLLVAFIGIATSGWPDRASGLALTSPEHVRARLRYHITHAGSGQRDGSSWSDAGTLRHLPGFIKKARPGAEILIDGDSGPYAVTSEIAISAGGAPGRRIVIRGVSASGVSEDGATMVGRRGDSQNPKRARGSEIFRLLPGADHLLFENLNFQDIGNGAFRIGGDIKDLVIDRVTGRDVMRLVETRPSGTLTTASVTGFVLRRSRISGFSRGAVRLAGNSQGILIEDVVGDGQMQPNTSFAMGVHLKDSVHDVMIRRVVMGGSADGRKRPDKYWNGDGFATEDGVYNVTFVDTEASDNDDGGYDLKSSATRLIRTRAYGNKRNYRFWSKGIEVEDCVARDPYKRGGSGNQAQVYVTSGASVTMTGCVLTDNSSDTTVYQVSEGSQLRVIDDVVRFNSSGRYSFADANSRILED